MKISMHDANIYSIYLFISNIFAIGNNKSNIIYFSIFKTIYLT